MVVRSPLFVLFLLFLWGCGARVQYSPPAPWEHPRLSPKLCLVGKPQITLGDGVVNVKFTVLEPPEEVEVDIYGTSGATVAQSSLVSLPWQKTTQGWTATIKVPVKSEHVWRFLKEAKTLNIGVSLYDYGVKPPIVEWRFALCVQR